MNRKYVTSIMVIIPLLFFGNISFAQFIDESTDRVKTPLVVDMKRIGTLKPRSSSEIEASRIAVGCETLDRDLTIWDNYKSYLKPLGAKNIRLQAGWAKCEKVPGVYEWEWLDKIINYAVANDIEPWLEASYGNPAYDGGGGTGLLNSLMTSEEAYAAWDRWVEALVLRYKDRVKEWEIWNEPDHPMQEISPEEIAKLNIRTAEIIKNIQPEAKIAGLAMASNSDQEYLDRFLKVISDEGKLDLFDWITYHAYTIPPESAYSEERVFGLRNVIKKYSSTLKLRQGENGAPSTYIPSFALSKMYWTEYTQAKYDMRRLLGDLGNDIETSVFTIIDIYYKPVLNTKGLIQSDITRAAIRPKVAYYAVQNITSIFDIHMIPDPDLKISSDLDESISAYGFQDQNSKSQLVTLWLDGQPVTNSFETRKSNIVVKNARFSEPVWIDLMTGHMYEIPESNYSFNGSDYSFKNIPVYDAPVIIANRSMIRMMP